MENPKELTEERLFYAPEEDVKIVYIDKFGNTEYGPYDTYEDMMEAELERIMDEDDD
ncbi:dipeptidase [Pontibacter aydingkolensis]|uniref:Uncharacterized protein n=1 Tax=Pontibacter aydingkolensis TaxID=1911536 RepID=A0ABS7CQZ9_9BACT|nr:hypothetical protein [Pontibacter aydingkolensis]MBW7466213.1 hypothetical protein [Pontibacter aydingkolensis]